MLLVVLALGCARAPRPSPPPAPVGTIAVLPPNNRTGDSLLVASNSFWNPYAAGSQRVTVADVLAAEARSQLERRGFTVAAADAVEAAVGQSSPGSLQEAAELVARSKLADTALFLGVGGAAKIARSYLHRAAAGASGSDRDCVGHRGSSGLVRRPDFGAPSGLRAGFSRAAPKGGAGKLRFPGMYPPGGGAETLCDGRPRAVKVYSASERNPPQSCPSGCTFGQARWVLGRVGSAEMGGKHLGIPPYRERTRSMAQSGTSPVSWRLCHSMSCAPEYRFQ